MNAHLSYRKRSRRGVTLVELLVSLSLLAMLVSVAVSWMTTTVSRQGRDLEQSRWLRSANLVLDQVGRDLSQLEMVDDEWRRGDPRVWLEGETLFIRTTEVGVPSTLRYALDSQGGCLERTSVDAQIIGDQAAPLLGEAESLNIEITMPSETQALPSLRVEIRSVGGQTLSRLYWLRTQDVQP